MKAFDELDARGLHWIQTSGWMAFKPTYELRDGRGNTLATMRHLHWWKSTVEVDAPGNRWIFERKGAMRRNIEIESVGTGQSPARYYYQNWGTNGTLTLDGGQVFHWRRSNFWGNKWGWMDSNEQPLIAFDAGGWMKSQAEVRFDEDADFPSLLLFLGWYLYRLYATDSGAGASIAASG